MTLTNEQIRITVRLKSEGQSNNVVAEKAGCSVSSVKKYYQKHQKKQLSQSYYLPVEEKNHAQKSHGVKYLSTDQIYMPISVNEDGSLDEELNYTLDDHLDYMMGVQEQIRCVLSSSVCKGCNTKMSLAFYCEKCQKWHVRQIPYIYFDLNDVN